ncbi:polysaccharide deacetylase family protein [Candidatus Wolfebacteria bacterium]|nr:polysaccharide deacetylase family protein [Candidatus Wolfebacteria bacterium]
MKERNKDFYFTTSWDDGSVNDLKLSKLLGELGVKGTFYIPKDFIDENVKRSFYGRRLSAEEIKTISLTQDIGAHSLSHGDLTRLSDAELQKEILGSREFLEEIIGKKIELFSFPYGKFDGRVVSALKAAGYIGARTTQTLNFKIPEKTFIFGPSISCASFPFNKINAQKNNKRLFEQIKNYGGKLFSLPLLIRHMYSWQPFARSSLKHALKRGNYFHLCGHSWELERYGLWKELKSFLEFAVSQKGIKFITNSEMARLVNNEK